MSAMQKAAGKRASALKAAFPNTIPILTGFLFLGFTYGVYMRSSGFTFAYPLFMSMTIFAGSMEFLTTDLLLGGFAPLAAFGLTLMVNARHLFYGISMLDKYKNMGIKKFYLIFGLCDETFSINYTAQIPEQIDKGWFYLWVSVLDQFYWVLGATLGGLFGGMIPFSTKGLDFVMTALFVVIFLEQWEKEKNHFTAYIGLGVSLLSLIIFGAGNFLLPSMAGILVLLTLCRKPFEKMDEEVAK